MFDPVFGKLDVRMPDDVRRVTRCAVSRTVLPEPAGMTAVVARANTSGPDADSGGPRGPAPRRANVEALTVCSTGGVGAGRHRGLGLGKERYREPGPVRGSSVWSSSLDTAGHIAPDAAVHESLGVSVPP